VCCNAITRAKQPVTQGPRTSVSGWADVSANIQDTGNEIQNRSGFTCQKSHRNFFPFRLLDLMKCTKNHPGRWPRPPHGPWLMANETNSSHPASTERLPRNVAHKLLCDWCLDLLCFRYVEDLPWASQFHQMK